MILDCFLQVRLKPNILWMCRRSALEASTRQRSRRCALFLCRSPALTFKKTQKCTRFGPRRAAWELGRRPPAGKAAPLPLSLVCFSIWFWGVFLILGFFSPLSFLAFRVSFCSQTAGFFSNNKNLEAKFSQYFFQPPDKNL